MDERSYCASLEFRICSELSRRPEKELLSIWCDGVAPGRFIAERRPRIEGTARMGVTGQEEWTYTLFVGRRVRSASELDWESLLPAEEASGWLSLDIDRRIMTIDPSSRRLPITTRT